MAGLKLISMSLTIFWAICLCDMVEEKKCGDCDSDSCVPPKNCFAGMVKDRCGCCFVCGRREGESCYDPALPLLYRSQNQDNCGEHLECRPRTDLPESDIPEAQCVCLKSETLCGSDGLTYENECQLTEARYKRRDGLKAMHRGPCKSAPKIISPPEDVSNKTGGSVAMSCEVTGWPIPTVEWRVDYGAGDTFPLPNDDPQVAVQSRGGPSKYEVTGWLQLLNLIHKDDATYWCIAKNSEGVASAAAKIIVLDINREQLTKDLSSNNL